MPDVFISYSTLDERLARFVHDHLVREGLEVFLASINLTHGEHWTPQIVTALRESNWVFLLASPNALNSDSVKQEVGGAIFSRKKLVPIIWGLRPEDLPRWIADYQGIVLTGATAHDIDSQVSSLAKRVKADKVVGQLVAATVFAGLLYFLAKNE